MSVITITNQAETDAGWEFTVRTSAGTTHAVTLREEYYRELVGEAVLPAELIRESFAYLLEQEPASAILAEFRLVDIETYFPDYRQEITGRLAV